MLNSVILTATQKVIKSGEGKPCLYIHDVKFTSAAAGAKFNFYPPAIDEFVISRNYADNFADEIDIYMTISPKDYALMQDQGQDLLCLVTTTFVDKHGKAVYEPAPVQRQYHVMLNSAFDIRKALPDVQAYTEPSYKTSVRLVEKSVYELRHTKINAVYQSMTVEQAIYAITNSFGIEKIHLVTPDNTHVFDHITIGSYQSVSSIYGFLQSMCGIYSKGINSYIQDGCMYIYPALDTNPTYDKTTLVYLVDQGRYAGADLYHAQDGLTLSVVLNSQPKSYDMSVYGAENIGTGFVFNRASHLTDGITTIDKTEGAQFTKDAAIKVSLPNSRTAVKGNHNEVHIPATDNPYPMMSELIFYQASIMDFEWAHANPFLMEPPQRFVFYYDKNGTMVQKTGIMEKASYRYIRQPKSGNKDIFACMGKIALRLSPNETVVL